jgi:nitronate monooxygenase
LCPKKGTIGNDTPMSSPQPTTNVLAGLGVPIVQAPMAGGPSTPALAAGVNRAGGLGFLAAGYLSPDRVGKDIDALSALTDRSFGVNIFVGGGSPADPQQIEAYAARLAAEAEHAGVALGQPRFDDDWFDEKVAALIKRPVAVVSFTFGLPPLGVVDALRDAGSEVWVTITSPEEAARAAAAGADALIVQGVEAGGHRGVFVDDEMQSELTLLAALQLLRESVDLPLIAAGSIMTGAALGAVLVAGASAGQIGTALLRSAEAGTSPAQRAATATNTPTVLTRAFSGRLARGLTNRFHADHGAAAPQAYPEIHHLTSPLRREARRTGDADLINLWAGQAHRLAAELTAEEITRRMADDARQAITAAAARWGS